MRRRRRRRRRRTLKAPSCKRVIEQAALPAVTSTQSQLPNVQYLQQFKKKEYFIAGKNGNH